MFNKILWALGYIWALPVTLVALLLALVIGAKYSKREGLVLVFVASEWFTNLYFVKAGMAAFTWGGVIILRKNMIVWPELMKHELVHFKQCCIFGLFIVPLYGIGSLIALLRGKEAYYDNFLEVWARSES